VTVETAVRQSGIFHQVRNAHLLKTVFADFSSRYLQNLSMAHNAAMSAVGRINSSASKRLRALPLILRSFLEGLQGDVEAELGELSDESFGFDVG
jgi:hypothetical protein